MPNRVPEEFELYMNDGGQASPEGPVVDWLDEFLAKAQLAGAVGAGGHTIAEGLQTETAPIHDRHAQIYKTIAATEVRNDTSLDDESLAKSAATSGRARRILSLKKFLQERLATGDTAESVIEFANRHSPETASLLREIAASL